MSWKVRRDLIVIHDICRQALSLSEVLTLIMQIAPHSFKLLFEQMLPHPVHLAHIAFSPPLPALVLVRQRLPRLRTDLQHPSHLVQQGLVLDRRPTLQQLDIVRLCIHLLCQLRLRQLEALLRPPVLNRLRNLRVQLLWRYDVVRAVDFCEALPFGRGGFIGLGSISTWWRVQGVGIGQLTALPAVNFFSVATMAPERWAAFRAALPRTMVSR